MEPNEVMTDEELDAMIGDTEDEPDDSGVDLESFFADDEDQPEEDELDEVIEEEEEGESGEQQPEQEKPGTSNSKKEPGYVQGRIEKAVKKATEELNAEWQARFDAVIKPLQEKQIEDEAQELVRSRKVGDIETARELVRFRKGQQQTQPSEAPQAQPRQANGQFAPKQDPVISARIEILGHQADTIKAKTGIDVMAEFDRNPEIKKAVLSGEMDFYEVAEQIKARPQKRKPPAPIRHPNGASGQAARDINSLSDKQFDRLVKVVRERG